MARRVGINGFGRIGRQSLKALIERAPGVEVVAINDLVPTEMNAHLLKHDSTYGAYPGTVEHTEDTLVIDGHAIRVLQERDPASLPWGDLGVDIVVESTGLFTDATKARAHLDAGARKVIISAPAKNEDSRSCSASTRTPTTRRAMTSSATRAARRTAWLRRPRSSTTTGRSRAGS
jgi:glyceraldehyde 3-phosphate dehydrogenase